MYRVERSTRVPIAVWLSGAHDQVALPVAGDGAVLDLGRPVADHDHLVDESMGALAGLSLGLAAGPAGAQRGLHLALQPATGLEVQRLVDRLVAHAHALIVWIVLDEPVRDLLRGQLAFQTLLDLCAQRGAREQLGVLGSGSGSCGSTLRLMGQVDTRDAVLAHLPRHRRLVLADAGRDRGQRVLVDQAVRDCQPVIEGQVAITDHGVGCSGHGLDVSGPGARVHDRAVAIDPCVVRLVHSARPVLSGARVDTDLPGRPGDRPAFLPQLIEPRPGRRLPASGLGGHQLRGHQNSARRAVAQPGRDRGPANDAGTTELVDHQLSQLVGDLRLRAADTPPRPA